MFTSCDCSGVVLICEEFTATSCGSGNNSSVDLNPISADMAGSSKVAKETSSLVGLSEME